MGRENVLDFEGTEVMVYDIPYQLVRVHRRNEGTGADDLINEKLFQVQEIGAGDRDRDVSRFGKFYTKEHEKRLRLTMHTFIYIYNITKKNPSSFLESSAKAGSVRPLSIRTESMCPDNSF
jgi:hypothetical protein